MTDRSLIETLSERARSIARQYAASPEGAIAIEKAINVLRNCTLNELTAARSPTEQQPKDKP